MPGISTTGVYQQVRRMTIPIANWTGAAVSGAGDPTLGQLCTLHGLTDGRAAGLPSWVAEQLDAFRAWVVLTSGATYGNVESFISFPSYSVAGTDRVQVLVATQLADECWARFPNDAPLRVEIRALFKSPHSIEGRGADQGEGFPVAPLGSIFSVPRGGVTAGIEEVYIDPLLGLDTNDGHAAGAGRAWQTMGRVKTYMEFVGVFQHSLAVYPAAGPDTDWTAARSNFAPEGVIFMGESRPYFMGNPPAPDATLVNVDKALTIAVGAAGMTTPRDCDHLRMTPANGEIWQDTNAAGNVALVAADIGKTVHITDGNHVAYATISAVDGRGAAIANRWVEINVNQLLLGAGAQPAWISAAGTIWTILDPLDPLNTQVTAMAGTWNLCGIHSTQGSALQTDTTPSKSACIAHIRFTTAQVTLEDCDRFALPGCRFEAGIQWLGCRDCSTMSNAVSDNLADRYFPDAIWAAQGFTDVGTANAYGGMGFFVVATAVNNVLAAANLVWTGSKGLVAGMVITGAAAPNMGFGLVQQISDVVATWGSWGPDGANMLTMYAQARSRFGFLNCRQNSQCRSDVASTVICNSNNSWLARAINLADDVPVPGTPATHVTCALGMLRSENGGEVVVPLDAVTAVEGINADAANSLAVRIGESGKLVATGGHDALFAGCRGWLYMAGSSQGFMSGNRTFAAKPNGVASFDIYLDNARLTTSDALTKAAADTTLCGFIRARGKSTWVHGSAENDTGQLVWGAHNVGNGINSGAFSVIDADDGSYVEIGNPYINKNDAGAATISVLHGAHVHLGGDGTSLVEIQGVAAAAIQVGVAAASAGWVPGAAAAVVRNDLPAAPGGNEHLALYETE